MLFSCLVLSRLLEIIASAATPIAFDDVKHQLSHLTESLVKDVMLNNVTEIPDSLITWNTYERYGQKSMADHTLYNDLWNQPLGNGAQCTGTVGVDATSWYTKWSWQQSAQYLQVISYANVERAFGTGVPLSRYASLRSRWRASYTGLKMSSNVAYDIFIAPPGGGEQIEIMSWIKQYGAVGPIADSDKPLAEITLPSGNWTLWQGRNSYSHMDVYSFIRSDAKTVGTIDYKGDLLEFLHHLIHRGVITNDWRLLKIGAGTEATAGSDCLFFTSRYTLDPVEK